MSEFKNPRRSKSLVDPEVQGSLLRKIGLHWCMLFVSNTIALVVWVRLFEQPDADWNTTFHTYVERFLPFFVVSIALLPAFVWDTLKLTHRFAGPILRLRLTLMDAAEGRAVAPLSFRSNDFWREIAENFNTILSQRVAPEANSQTKSTN